MSDQCPRCQAPYVAGHRFCQSCGAPLQAAAVAARPAYAGGSYGAARGHATSGYEKAPLGARFWAALIDGFICLGLSLPAFFCFYLALQKSKRSFWDEGYDPGGVYMLALIGILLYLLPLTYSFIKDGLGQGQSWGKRNMYLMVIDLSNQQPCGIGKSIARNLISGLIGIIPFIGWLIEPIIVLASDSGRKLGDMASNTQVIRTDQFSEYNP